MALTVCGLTAMAYKGQWAHSPPSAGLLNWKTFKDKTVALPKKTVHLAAFFSTVSIIEASIYTYKFSASLILSGCMSILAAAVIFYVALKFFKALYNYRSNQAYQKCYTDCLSKYKHSLVNPSGSKDRKFVAEPSGLLLAGKTGFNEVKLMLSALCPNEDLSDKRILFFVITSDQIAPYERFELVRVIFAHLAQTQPELLQRALSEAFFVSVKGGYCQIARHLATVSDSLTPFNFKMIHLICGALCEKWKLLLALLDSPEFLEKIKAFHKTNPALSHDYCEFDAKFADKPAVRRFVYGVNLLASPFYREGAWDTAKEFIKNYDHQLSRETLLQIKPYLHPYIWSRLENENSIGEK